MLKAGGKMKLFLILTVCILNSAIVFAGGKWVSKTDERIYFEDEVCVSGDISQKPEEQMANARRAVNQIADDKFREINRTSLCYQSSDSGNQRYSQHVEKEVSDRTVETVQDKVVACAHVKISCQSTWSYKKPNWIERGLDN
jgi:hypothetical protein